MFKIIKYSKIWILIPAVLALGSLVIFLVFGLKLGIDFTGGSLVQVQFNQAPALSEVKDFLSSTDWADSQIQVTGDKGIIIRTKELNDEQKNNLLESLRGKFGDLEEQRFDTIGPTIGKELRQKAVTAIIFVLVGIIIYLAYAFRKVSGPVPSWKFGVCAVIALIHDVLITIGVFVLLGHFANVEVDTLFVVALLTVVGYSVHDTIVVFDRMRAILLKESLPFDDVADKGIRATMTRSVNTSLTTLFVLIAIFLFGGETIHYFVLALIVGIAVGTYSSVFVATPVLVLWQKWQKARR